MQSAGIIENIAIDYKTNKTKITLLLDSKDLEEIEKLSKLEKLTIEIKKFFKKRSLDSNAYAWKLITELANVMKLDKEEVYLMKLKQYGQSDLVLLKAIVEPKRLL